MILAEFPADPTVMLVVFLALMLLSVILLIVKRYKRCPSNNILVVYGKVGDAEAAKCVPCSTGG